jgi:hypothetical protein
MATYDTDKMIPFIRSVLWDLDIPQEVATVLYKDNDAPTAMRNAQKPTPQTRHMDIKTSHYENGLTEISCTWNGLTPVLTWRIILLRDSNELYSTAMLTSF